ncbi:MAG: glycogen-binding domain-containing protein [Flavobacteriales bacterium]|nr:glycogen-binding domain-containing protein [Flavobacteriales bacterium]
MEMSDGISRFRLEGHQNAQEVLLSGSFNNWRTSGMAMQKSKNGWEVKLKLVPGRYEYKFIVDGTWMRDLENLQKLNDTYGDFNSVYFKPNVSFTIERDAKKKNGKYLVCGVVST